jgi:twitching motility protein PilT
MQTLNDALYQLYMSREVTDEECLRVSGDPNEFLRMIGRMPLDDGSSEKPSERPLTGGLNKEKAGAGRK